MRLGITAICSAGRLCMQTSMCSRPVTCQLNGFRPFVTEAPGSARRFVHNCKAKQTHIPAGHTQQRWCLRMSSRFHELGKVPGHMLQAPCQAHDSNLTYAITKCYCACTCKSVRQHHFAQPTAAQLQSQPQSSVKDGSICKWKHHASYQTACPLMSKFLQ